MDILLDFGKQRVKALILGGALIQIDNFMTALLVISSFEVAVFACGKGIGDFVPIVKAIGCANDWGETFGN